MKPVALVIKNDGDLRNHGGEWKQIQKGWTRSSTSKIVRYERSSGNGLMPSPQEVVKSKGKSYHVPSLYQLVRAGLRSFISWVYSCIWWGKG